VSGTELLGRTWRRRAAGHLVRRALRALVRPVWNLAWGLARRSLVHPLALVGPRVRLGRGCLIGRCRLDTMDAAGGTIVIGDRTVVYSGVEVLVHRGRVEIGRDCLITRGAALVTGGHGFRRADRLIREQPLQWGDIRIGDDCWIGYRAVVLGGVTVGRGAVVGAGSVVASDVPPYTVVAGAPARPVARRGEAGAAGAVGAPAGGAERVPAGPSGQGRAEEAEPRPSGPGGGAGETARGAEANGPVPDVPAGGREGRRP